MFHYSNLYSSNLVVENGKDLEFSSISVSMNMDQHGKPVNSADAFELLTRAGDDSSSELLLTDSLRFRVRYLRNHILYVKMYVEACLSLRISLGLS